MFANPLINLVVVVVLEAISAVVEYLKGKLRNSEFGFNQYA